MIYAAEFSSLLLLFDIQLVKKSKDLFIILFKEVLLISFLFDSLIWSKSESCQILLEIVFLSLIIQFFVGIISKRRIDVSNVII